jgi:hypothetical protein
VLTPEFVLLSRVQSRVLFEAWVDPNLTRTRGNEAALDSPHGYSVNALMGSAAGAESRSGKAPIKITDLKCGIIGRNPVVRGSGLPRTGVLG